MAFLKNYKNKPGWYILMYWGLGYKTYQTTNKTLPFLVDQGFLIKHELEISNQLVYKMEK